MAISGTQWYSAALSGTPCNQSDAINLSPAPSRAPTRPPLANGSLERRSLVAVPRRRDRAESAARSPDEGRNQGSSSAIKGPRTSDRNQSEEGRNQGATELAISLTSDCSACARARALQSEAIRGHQEAINETHLRLQRLRSSPRLAIRGNQRPSRGN